MATLRNLWDWRKLLIYSHRWLGIVGCLLFILWFGSGLVMMYARMPRLTAEERLMRLPGLDLSAARVSPAEAAAGAELSPERLRVGMLGNRPVYRFLSNGQDWTTIFADTGRPLRGMTQEEALGIVRNLVPEHASTLRYDASIEDSDQWTLSTSIRAQMPLHRIALGDAADTYMYVSDRTGDAAMKTTSSDRNWAFWGPVLHYIYFTPFRRQADLWKWSIIWASAIGSVMCVLGLAIGIWRFSVSRRYRLKGVHSSSPYAGFMKWHHYAGLTFGLAGFTWVLSGMFSLNPFAWAGSSPTTQQKQAVAGGPIALHMVTLERLRAAASMISPSFAPKELEFLQFRGEPFFMAYRPPDAGDAANWTNTDLGAYLSPMLTLEHRLVSAVAPDRGVFTEFDKDAVLEAAQAAMPGSSIEDTAWLSAYDAYYYDKYNGRPLPVLRVRYADPLRTWLYLDPRHGLIGMKQERSSRTLRWLYHGLHSLDFPFLYYRRPLWDIVLIVLSLGGIALSVTTLMPAWHRLMRHTRRFRKFVTSFYSRRDSQVRVPGD